jgi:hypothetical protein
MPSQRAHCRLRGTGQRMTPVTESMTDGQGTPHATCAEANPSRQRNPVQETRRSMSVVFLLAALTFELGWVVALAYGLYSVVT